MNCSVPCQLRAGLSKPLVSPGNCNEVFSPKPNAASHSRLRSLLRVCEICTVPKLDESTKILRTVICSSPCGYASLISCSHSVSLLNTCLPGTENVDCGVTVPSSMAAATLNTLATEPGSWASTAAMFPAVWEYVPSSLRRTFDIA